jgi:hypothetical protein
VPLGGNLFIDIFELVTEIIQQEKKLVGKTVIF